MVGGLLIKLIVDVVLFEFWIVWDFLDGSWLFVIIDVVFGFLVSIVVFVLDKGVLLEDGLLGRIFVYFFVWRCWVIIVLWDMFEVFSLFLELSIFVFWVWDLRVYGLLWRLVLWFVSVDIFDGRWILIFVLDLGWLVFGDVILFVVGVLYFILFFGEVLCGVIMEDIELFLILDWERSEVLEGWFLCCLIILLVVELNFVIVEGVGVVDDDRLVEDFVWVRWGVMFKLLMLERWELVL